MSTLQSPPHTQVDFDAVTSRLSVRARHALVKNRVRDISAFLKLTREDLLRTKNCGKVTIEEIETVQLDVRAEPGKDAVPEQCGQNCFANTPAEVFGAIRDQLSVRAVHALDSVGVDDLEAFMKVDYDRLIRCRNCGRKTANEILEMQSGLMQAAKQAGKDCARVSTDQLLSAPCLLGIPADIATNSPQDRFLIDVENPAPWLAAWVSNLAHSPHEASAFFLRKGMLGFAPMRLDIIGKQVGGVCRERVRQMVRTVEERASVPNQQRRLRPLMSEFAAVVRQRGGLVGLAEVTKAVLCRGQDGRNLKFATELVSFFATLAVWKEEGLSLDDNKTVGTGTAESLVARLAAIVEEVAANAADERLAKHLWSIDRELLRAALSSVNMRKSDASALTGLSDALLSSIIQKCEGRIKPRGKRFYSNELWRLRFGNVVTVVDAVLKQSAAPMHFSKVADEVRKWRPDFSDRNTHSTLDRCGNALLWDLGTFLHRDNVAMPLSLLHDVERWLLRVLAEGVPFVSINGAHVHFRARCEQAGLTSEVALYSCLRQTAHPRLVFPRIPCVYLKQGFTDRLPMVLALEHFLRDAGGPVSQQELEQFGLRKLYLKDYQLTQLSQRVSNVIRTNDWGYVHLDNLVFHRESLEPLIQYTKTHVEKEQHCSVQKIYRDKRVTCAAAGIDGPIMLYSLLHCFAEDVFVLDGYPRIAKRMGGQEQNRQTLKARVVAFVRESGQPCPFDVLEAHFVDRLGYSEQQMYSVWRAPDVCMYHPNCVIHFEALGWNTVKQTALEQAALHVYTRAIRAGGLFGRISLLVESPDLPDLPSPLHWSPTLVSDLLTKGGQYLILGDKREIFVPRNNQHGIQSMESLIAKILTCDWGGAANITAFETALVRAGIIRKRLGPAISTSGSLVVLKRGEIMLKELQVDASRP